MGTNNTPIRRSVEKYPIKKIKNLFTLDWRCSLQRKRMYSARIKRQREGAMRKWKKEEEEEKKEEKKKDSNRIKGNSKHTVSVG
jgi:hypothetical protein